MPENIIATINHKKYDHVFRIVFNEPKELLSLYNALSGRNYENPDELEITTLEDAIFIGMKNDLSFIIDNYMNVFEHQSTINPNIPLRGLFYLSDLYKQQYRDLPIYSKRKIKLLTPRFIVFYNGLEELPDKYDMKLSDSFLHSTKEPDLEVVAHVININYGHNTDLSDRCQKLKEYQILVDRIHKELKPDNKENHKKIIVRIIDECIKEGILVDILSRERNRIMESFLSQFDADEYVKIIKSEGYDEGHDKGKEDMLISLYMEGIISFDDAIKRSSMSEASFQKAIDSYKDEILN